MVFDDSSGFFYVKQKDYISNRSPTKQSPPNRSPTKPSPPNEGNEVKNFLSDAAPNPTSISNNQKFYIRNKKILSSHNLSYKNIDSEFRLDISQNIDNIHPILKDHIKESNSRVFKQK